MSVRCAKSFGVLAVCWVSDCYADCIRLFSRLQAAFAPRVLSVSAVRPDNLMPGANSLPTGSALK